MVAMTNGLEALTRLMRFDDLEARPLEVMQTVYRELGLDGFENAKPAMSAVIAGTSDYRKNPRRLDADVGAPDHGALALWLRCLRIPAGGMGSADHPGAVVRETRGGQQSGIKASRRPVGSSVDLVGRQVFVNP